MALTNIYSLNECLQTSFPPGGSRWVNEPARASEPLGVHWGNFAESRVLKQTWLRDGRTDGRTDLTEFGLLYLYGGKV